MIKIRDLVSRPKTFKTKVKHLWWDVKRWTIHRYLKAAVLFVPMQQPLGSKEDLRAFVASMVDTIQYKSVVKRRGRHFVHTQPLDYDFNRDIHAPGKNPRFPWGVVGVRMDDDFWTCILLPYRFREVSIQDIIEICYPDLDPKEIEYRPDSGSPEQDAFYIEREKQHEERLARIQAKEDAGIPLDDDD